MKTIGEILKTARLKQDFSVDKLSSLTKIDSKYIVALEADRFDLLPSETFIKGFIRNLSLKLNLNPTETISIFRRDYKVTPSNKEKNYHLHQKKINLSFITSQITLFIVGFLVFLIYLAIQFRAVIAPPKIKVLQPTSNSVLVSPIDIEGQTSPDALIIINGETRVKPDQSGRFITRINLPVGETIITVKVTNRFSRTSTQEIPVTVVSP